MPPVVIAAGIGAAASIGGAVLANKANKKASKSAERTAANTTAANNALARENRDFAFTQLNPYSQHGLQAQNILGGLLWGGTPQTNALSPAPAGGTAGKVMQNPDGSSSWRSGGMRPDPGMGGDFRANQYTGQPTALPAPGTVTTTQTPMNGQTAFDTFRNSSNYQFRFNEGMRGLTSGLANNGLMDSGAAAKEIVNYSHGMAGNALGEYIGMLTGQQQIGMGAASAMVGVGQNTTNALMANNNNLGTVQANAALMRGNAQGQMWGGIANGIGQVAGALGSSYGRSTPPINGSIVPNQYLPPVQYR